MEDQPSLSIVIPAHNEAKRLPRSLRSIIHFLKTQSYQGEVLVIENGSSDQTAAIVSIFSAMRPEIRLIQEKNRGKGQAVRRGLSEARGEFILVTDADLSTPIETLPNLLSRGSDGSLVIGSREISGSQRINEPTYRHLMGRVFNRLIQMMTITGYNDTQCGFKLFSKKADEIIAPRITLRGMAYDVEVLAIARAHHIPVIEHPVVWQCDQDSKVKIVSDTIDMIRDLWHIRKNIRRQKYN